MNWFTENPWPLIMLLVGFAVLALILGQSKARLGAVVLLLLAAGVYLLEGMIITPSERIEVTLQAMHKAFVADDLTTINSMIADESPQLRETAKKGLGLVDLDDGFHLQDVVVTLADDQKSAEIQLRANGTVQLRDNSVTTHVATRWRTKWVAKDEKWLLSDVHRLDPMTGNEIGVLERQ